MTTRFTVGLHADVAAAGDTARAAAPAPGDAPSVHDDPGARPPEAAPSPGVAGAVRLAVAAAGRPLAAVRARLGHEERDVPQAYPLLTRATLDACIKCTICESACPVAAVTPKFSGPKFVGPQGERFRDGESVDHSLDYCSSCGVCTMVCPQGVKIAEINSVARAEMKAGHMPLRDRLISDTVLMGRLMTPVAPLANWALGQGWVRFLMEKVVGVHRDAPMPTARPRTFESWWRSHQPPTAPRTRGPVVFFHGCAGGFFEVETSIRTVEVLEHLGYEVLVPKQGCCGLAKQSNGLFDGARHDVMSLVAALNSASDEAASLTIVSSSGSCTGMLKHEAHEILGLADPALLDVGTRIRETSEFLRELLDTGVLDPATLRPLDLAVPYHAPCQVRGQGMGSPAIEVLHAIPGVGVIESEVACCGIAGTYGIKREKYDIAQAVGQPLFDLVRNSGSDLAVCDTETCRWQIEKATGVRTVHPVHLVHAALGLSDLSDAPAAGDSGRPSRRRWVHRQRPVRAGADQAAGCGSCSCGAGGCGG